MVTGRSCEVGEHRRRDPRVVVDDLTFGEAGRGVQDLVEVREAQPPALHLDRRASAPADGCLLDESGHDLRR